MPKSKREKPSVSPADLAERIEPFVALRAEALIRKSLEDTQGASEVLERLAEALRLLDDTAPPGTANQPAPADPGTKAKHTRRPRKKTAR